jgi:phosphatidylinositol alpha-1,6-mannosyltransferase
MPARSRLFGLEVEGLGIVYLEAAACGLPVIVGNSGGAPDAVKDKKTGFVVDGNDIDEIALRIIYLIKNRNIRKMMGAAGVKFANQEWRLKVWSDRFNKLIKGKA